MKSRNSPSLEELLKKAQSFGCEYDEQLSNHLPMALIALDRMSASEEQLRGFYNHHSKRLVPQAEDSLVINAGNWREHLGKHKLNSAYRDFFLRELRKDGVPATISHFVSILLPGVSGAAFHPLIRLAYGLEAGSDWEVAEALASWCMAYLELGKISATPKAEPTILWESLQLLARKQQESPFVAKGNNIFLRLVSVTGTKTFSDYFSGLDFSNASLKEVAESAIRFYLSTKDSFVALHCVTSTHALRMISPYVLANGALPYLWQGISAVYQSIECPKLRDRFEEIPGLPGWEEIFKAARGNKDDHVVKFVYTAHEEFKHYGSPLYLEAAAKKAGLVPWK